MKRNSGSPDAKEIQKMKNRGSKAARRYYSALLNQVDGAASGGTRGSDIIGPRCTSLPLCKKHRCSIKCAKIRRFCNSVDHNIPIPLRISFSLFTEMPIPPATSPVESNYEIFDEKEKDIESSRINEVPHSRSNKQDKDRNGEKKKRDSKSARDGVKEKLSRRKISVLKFDAEEVIACDSDLQGCRWQSSMGSLRPRSSTTPSIECNIGSSRNETKASKVSAAKSDGHTSSKSRQGVGESPLKVCRYSYCDLKNVECSYRPVKMVDSNKDACRSVFMLTHKGVQKYTLQLREGDFTKTGGSKKNCSTKNMTIDLSFTRNPALLKTAETPLSNWEKKQLIESIISKSKIDGCFSSEKAVDDISKTISKSRNVSTGNFFSKVCGTAGSSSCHSPNSQTGKRRSRSSSSKMESHTFDHIIFEQNENEIPKQQLLPQNRVKNKLRLRVSDILSTVESVNRVEKFKQRRLREFKQQAEACQGREGKDPRKRKLLEVQSKIHSVWQNSLAESHPDSYLAAALGRGRCSSRGRELKCDVTDDRFAKSTEDAAYIMRKRDKKTSQMLQQPDPSSSKKIKHFG
eukprot:gene17345-8925_t